MEGYSADTYGEGFADVYDDWYRAIGDPAALVRLVHDETTGRPDGGPPRLLELGVGTGRLALPLAASGIAVTGVDASPAMLDVLRAADPGGSVKIVLGDMVDDVPAGPFDVVLVAYNTLFNLPSHERQGALFEAVRRRLTADGCLLVEAFVPDDPPRPQGSEVLVRSMTATSMVLSASVHDPAGQRIDGQFVELTSGGVRLRPWSIRYAGTAELDEMASAAGLELAARYTDAARTPFDDDDSDQHLSVYRLTRQ